MNKIECAWLALKIALMLYYMRLEQRLGRTEKGSVADVILAKIGKSAILMVVKRVVSCIIKRNH
jgi:hypothetical protein